MKKALDQEAFEAAKIKCGFSEAAYFEGGFGFALAPNQDSPSPEQQRKLECMARELFDRDYSVVTETPPPE